MRRPQAAKPKDQNREAVTHSNGVWRLEVGLKPLSQFFFNDSSRASVFRWWDLETNIETREDTERDI